MQLQGKKVIAIADDALDVHCGSNEAGYSKRVAGNRSHQAAKDGHAFMEPSMHAVVHDLSARYSQMRRRAVSVSRGILTPCKASCYALWTLLADEGGYLKAARDGVFLCIPGFVQLTGRVNLFHIWLCMSTFPPQAYRSRFL